MKKIINLIVMWFCLTHRMDKLAYNINNKNKTNEKRKNKWSKKIRLSI